MKHTKGPWTAFIPKTDVTEASVKGADGITFAEMGGFGQDRETNEANARLIAAAPEMLEALIAIVNYCENRNLPYPASARAAIAKARGES